MSVKLSNSQELMSVLLRSGMSLVLVCMVSGCASMGMPTLSAMWREFKGEREPQVVYGSRQPPIHNMEMLSGVPTIDGTVGRNGASPQVRYQTYIPVVPSYPQTHMPANPSVSEPVMLKRDVDSNDEYNGNYTPMPMPEPTFFDKMSGWFSSALTSDSASSRKPSVAMTMVSNVEAVAVKSTDKTDYLPLSSVPEVPARMYRLRAEAPKFQHMLEREHATSIELRGKVDAQRAEEASGSLLAERNALTAN
jgi:hypothetical protein